MSTARRLRDGLAWLSVLGGVLLVTTVARAPSVPEPILHPQNCPVCQKYHIHPWNEEAGAVDELGAELYLVARAPSADGDRAGMGWDRPGDFGPPEAERRAGVPVPSGASGR